MIPQTKPFLSESEVLAVTKVIKSAFLASGTMAKTFEQKIASLIGIGKTFGVNSGTAAIFILLQALNIKHAKIAIPGYACTSLYYAVKSAGFEPVICDIDNSSLCISTEELIPLKNKIDTAIAVHTFGIFCGNNIFDIGIPIIEDCAHSLGVHYNNRPVGSFGVASIFSFYPTKIITCAGSGGAIYTNNKDIAEKIMDIKTYDSLSKKYLYGYHSDLTDIDAAIGLEQLKKLKKILKRKREIAKQYNKSIPKDFLVLRNLKSDTFCRYIIKAKSKKQADNWISQARAVNIILGRPLDKPLFLLDNNKHYPNSRNAYDTIVSVPIFPSLRTYEVNLIADFIGGLQ